MLRYSPPYSTLTTESSIYMLLPRPNGRGHIEAATIRRKHRSPDRSYPARMGGATSKPATMRTRALAMPLLPRPNGRGHIEAPLTLWGSLFVSPGYPARMGGATSKPRISSRRSSESIPVTPPEWAGPHRSVRLRIVCCLRALALPRPNGRGHIEAI